MIGFLNTITVFLNQCALLQDKNTGYFLNDISFCKKENSRSINKPIGFLASRTVLIATLLLVP